MNHFYDVNDIIIRQKKIAKFLSSDDVIITDDDNNNNSNNNDSGNGDKPYTHEQIAKLLEFADIEQK